MNNYKSMLQYMLDMGDQFDVKINPLGMFLFEESDGSQIAIREEDIVLVLNNKDSQYIEIMVKPESFINKLGDKIYTVKKSSAEWLISPINNKL